MFALVSLFLFKPLYLDSFYSSYRILAHTGGSGTPFVMAEAVRAVALGIKSTVDT